MLTMDKDTQLRYPNKALLMFRIMLHWREGGVTDDSYGIYKISRKLC